MKEWNVKSESEFSVTFLCFSGPLLRASVRKAFLPDEIPDLNSAKMVHRFPINQCVNSYIHITGGSRR